MVLVDGEAEDKLSNQCRLKMWSSHHDSDAFYFVKNAFLREASFVFRNKYFIGSSKKT